FRTLPTIRAHHSVAYSGVEVKRTPGSAPWCDEMWTWPSIIPGMIQRPFASSTSAPCSAPAGSAPTLAILLPSMTIAAFSTALFETPSISVPFLRIVRLAAAMGCIRMESESVYNILSRTQDDRGLAALDLLPFLLEHLHHRGPLEHAVL